MLKLTCTPVQTVSYFHVGPDIRLEETSPSKLDSTIDEPSMPVPLAREKPLMCL